MGKIQVSCRELGVDLMTVAGHKFYAPKGIGCLFIRQGVALSSLLSGSGQERGLSPGTENVANIVALGKAAEIARQRCRQDATRIAALRDQLESLLEEKTRPTEPAQYRLIVVYESFAKLHDTMLTSRLAGERPGCSSISLLFSAARSQ